MAHHTGQPIERIEADVERDKWMGAEEAKAYGMIDHVLEKQCARAKTNKAHSKNKTPPHFK